MGSFKLSIWLSRSSDPNADSVIALFERLRVACTCTMAFFGSSSNTGVNAVQKDIEVADPPSDSISSLSFTCLSQLPDAKSIAFFDTAFHRSVPAHISSYAINQKIAKQRGLKKYGFHGLSYSFILRSVSRFLKKPAESLNLIVLHLGSGASACCIRHGQSLDISMGLTPLNGLPGATRSGAVDPSLIFHCTKAGRMSHDKGSAVQLHVTQAEHILNTQAGWKALAGTTDFAAITAQRADDDAARLAFEMFADRILNYVGSYHLKLGGAVDVLVFSGEIGERSKELRALIG
ncbi:Acetokinase family-domain-containing protein [Mycena albidolilacea]|uniref:Acetokinase family-domain-containing protein n=1 Tax=Mycena albidolilacea TaxID=1033008 RepID=A0AAD7A965_9AGAR|nr:Acetokinase family-domain-containing protein [Mycena albidolilacea]